MLKCPRCGNILEDRGGLYCCNTRGCDVVNIEIHYKQPILNAFVKEALKK